MSKHTPGPWKVRDYKNSGLGVCQSIDENEVICWSAGTKREISRDRLSNAQLISASPDLLEALELVCAYYGHDDSQAIENARNAISKAYAAI